jgi:hypothetical protein
MEFDHFGLSVKDLATRNVITRCNSFRPLYTIHLPTMHPPQASTYYTLTTAAAPTSLWHRLLGHPAPNTLLKLSTSRAVICNKPRDVHVCHACQLGQHTRLLFHQSSSRATQYFDLIHCDLWASPVISVSGSKYYLIILDDFSHYSWTFPLRLKSDTFLTITQFFSFIRTQFGHKVKSVQCDNGREFNTSSRQFFLAHGMHFRMSCPYTSPQNGKAKHMLCTTNNIVRTLLFQASMPP